MYHFFGTSRSKCSALDVGGFQPASPNGKWGPRSFVFFGNRQFQKMPLFHASFFFTDPRRTPPLPPHAGSIWQQTTGWGACWAESSGWHWEFHLSREGHDFFCWTLRCFRMFSRCFQKGTCTSCHWLRHIPMNQPGFMNSGLTLSKCWGRFSLKPWKDTQELFKQMLGPQRGRSWSLLELEMEATLNH